MTSPIPGYAPDDPIHNYATLAEAETLTASRHQRALKAAEDYASKVQMANPKERMTGPKTVGAQVPVPAHVNPFAGLRCSVRGCKEPVQGFIMRGAFAMPEPQKSIADRSAEIIGRLSDAAYASLTFDEIELATKFGYPAERLQGGMVGKLPKGSLVPGASGEPRCLAHLQIPSAVPAEPVQPLGLDSLDHASHWRIVGGFDNLFVTVRDKHNVEARISPRDYFEHTGVWPGAA